MDTELLEKVCAALALCSEEEDGLCLSCEGCPYERTVGARCVTALMRDALAVLRTVEDELC